MKNAKSKIHRFKLSKLIRDRIPDIMRADGLDVRMRKVGKDEHIELLKDKLVEETTEVIKTQTVDEMLEELSDVLEVLHSLATMHDITIGQIEQRRLNKKQNKGGFENGIFCETVEVEASSPMLGYCRSKFTEIDT